MHGDPTTSQTQGQVEKNNRTAKEDLTNVLKNKLTLILKTSYLQIGTCRGFSGPIKQSTKRQNWTPTGQRLTSWLFTSAAKMLNQGLPGSNSTSGQNGFWTWDLWFARQALYCCTALLLWIEALQPVPTTRAAILLWYHFIFDTISCFFYTILFDFVIVWADNADACSVQYAGTGALKTDFTR